MKKVLLLVVVAVLALTVAAQASSVSFSWGGVFTNYANSHLTMSVGQGGQVNWYMDDFGVGILAESAVVGNNDDRASRVTVSEFQVSKWLSKSVAVGVGSGALTISHMSGVDHWFRSLGGDSASFPVVDILGTVQLLSGKGEKVNASLDFNLAARFCTTTSSLYVGSWGSGDMVPNLNSTVATLAVTLGL